MKVKKRVALAFVSAWVLTIVFAQLYYATPITSDAFERVRVAEAISQGILPQSTAIGDGNYNYPLLFDFLLASFSALLGAQLFTALNVLSIFIAIATVLTVFLIAKRLANEKIAAFSTILLFLSPWIFYRFVTSIPETMGILLFLLVFHTFSSKKNHSLFPSFFLLSTLLLTHYRSFATSVAVLFFYSLFSKKFFALAKVALIPTMAFLFLLPKSFQVSNPWVIEGGPLDYFSPFLILLAAAGLFVFLNSLFEKKEQSEENAELVLASFVLGSFALIPFAPFVFRQMVYLVFPTVFLGGVFLEKIVSPLKKKGRVLQIGLLASSVAISILVLGTILHRAAPFTSNELQTFSALKLEEGNVVLAPFTYNYAIPYYSSKKIVVGAFAEGVPDGSQRAYDLWNFFSKNSSSKLKKEIVSKYNADILCLDLEKNKKQEFKEVLGKLLVESQEVACYQTLR
ncbi:MAG: hypothetical protein ACE5DI_05840 [Candidatus Micrarchaeia archaeon]